MDSKRNGMKYLLASLIFIGLIINIQFTHAEDSKKISKQQLVPHTESENIQAIERGLTIAYRLDSAPMQFKNERGEADGILIDLWRLWSIKSGIQVKFVGAYNKEAQQMVKKGQADINAGLFSNAKRKQVFTFSDPILGSPYHLFLHPTLSSIQSIEEFYDYSLGVTQGSFHENYIRKHYPKQKLRLFDGYQNLFQAAENGEIDGFVTQPLYLNYYLRKQTEAGKTGPQFQVLKKALYSRSYQAAASKSKPEVIELINQYLKYITPEDLRVVKQHWQGKSSLTSRATQAIQFTPAEREWLKQHPVINIGVDGSWPPIDFVDKNGDSSGIAGDYLKHFEQVLGVEFNIYPGPTFKEMLNKVSQGELKVAATVVKTSERAQNLWFSEPFFTAQKVIVSKQGTNDFRTAADLFGRVVAIENGFSTQKQLQQEYPQIKLKPVESTVKALQEVSWGNVDAYIGNGAVAHWVMQEQQITNLRFSGDPVLTPAPQRFAIYRDEEWKLLPGILNKVLINMDPKIVKAINRHWMGIENAPQKTSENKLRLSEKEQRFLRQHPEINIGIDPAWPPIEFIDHQGKHQGLSAEFLKVLSEELGIQFISQNGLSWSQVIEKAKQEKIDMLPALVQSQEREQFLNFTQAYLNFSFVIFVPESQGFTTRLTDLYGKKVAVEQSYITHELLKRDHPDIELVMVKDSKQGLEQVSLGLVDAYVGNLTVGSYLISKHGLSNIKIGGTTPYDYDLRMGVRKDWPELISILDKYISSLTVKEKQQIRQKWLSIKYEVSVDRSVIRNIILAAAILLLIVLVWGVWIKRKKDQLEKSTEQLNRIINTIPLAIVLTEKDGTIIKANPHVMTEIKSNTGSVEGRNMGEFYDLQEERDAVLKALKEHGMVKDQQVHFRTDRGDVVTGLLSALPIQLGNQYFNLGMFVNLTERIKMEKALKQAKEESEIASQFKSHFLANMSHEIRTPMNAIVGLSHLALQTELNDKQHDYIHKVQISAHNLLGIINDILDFSKIEAGKLSIEQTEFLLDEVLDNLAHMVNLKAEEKGLELLFRRDLNIPEQLLGDPLRLGQVLINLVQNAIKFTENGEVIISVELRHIEPQRVSVEFSVTDSGIGIDDEQIKHLFDPFIQADSSITRKHGGTGLGLSISKQIVELMGGELRVNSELGNGSCFSFRVDFKTHQGASNKFKDLSAGLKGTQVLLVDDNPVSQEILTEMLESLSFSVHVAGSAQEAYTKLQELDNDTERGCELVLMDWHMPGENGIEALEHIRRQINLKSMPKFILITAYGREEVIQQAKQAQFDGFLIKPINPSLLFDSILAAFNREKVLRYRKPENLFKYRLKGQILLVEDNAINQQVARELLEGFGLTVHIAENGQQAVERVEQESFDLVFMDLQMPVMDGLQATRTIRSQHFSKQLPIIAMTAHAVQGDKERCLAAGMDDYLSKPIDPARLLDILVAWLGDAELDENYHPPNQANPQHLLPSQLPGIDLDWGLQRVGGNQQLYIKLLNDFQKNYADSCQNLREFLHTTVNDQMHETHFNEAIRLVHTLHGVAGNMGAIDLKQVSASLESYLKEQNRQAQPEKIYSLLEQFCVQTEIIFKSLEELKQYTPAIDNSSKTGEQAQSSQSENISTGQDSEINQEVLLGHLNQLQQLLQEGDSEAQSAMGELKNMLNFDIDNRLSLLVQTLEQQIDDYEFDEAMETLAQLADTTAIKE